jgi:polyribonucleotide nucleotidyltransferase
MPEVGERFLGTVVKTTTFGAFVSLLPGKDGLLHISEVRKLVGGKRIDNVDDVLAVGQKVQVELKEIDPRGKLSLAAVLPEGEGGVAADASDQGAAEAETETDTRGEDQSERGERREGGRNRQRGRRRGDRGDRTEEGSGSPEADQLVAAHDGGAPASSEDAAS